MTPRRMVARARAGRRGPGPTPRLAAVAVVLLVGMIGAATAQAQPISFLLKWGSLGSGDGQFNQPLDVLVDGSGNVYVADTGNQRIQRFDSSGTFLTKWGTFGNREGQFSGPHGIAVDGSGNIYVAETGNNRIQKFDSSGTFLIMWGWGVATGAMAFETCTSSCQAGLEGIGDGQFTSGDYVAADGSGNVYVTDSSNNRVQKFTSAGTFVTKWGSLGIGDGQFNQPLGVAVDRSGNVYVADHANNRVQKFDSTGTFVTSFVPVGSGGFLRPVGVTVDGSGNIYVAERLHRRIQKLDRSGTFLVLWGWGVATGAMAFETCTTSCQAGLSGGGDGQFNQPWGLVVDGSGNVYVVDELERRIQKFLDEAPGTGTDGDGDGVPDDDDICPGGDDNIDTDTDLVPDFCDACPLDAANDADGDGFCADVDTCPGGDDNVNTDGEGLPDFCDVCPLDPENDADADGICESDDNCPVIANENQADLDGDDTGDVCDDDIDGDGVLNTEDNCVFDANTDQSDIDEDGAGDVCDDDIDGDGVIDANDACVPSPVGAAVNTDGCAISELCPCAHPDGADRWKNHGAYVSCVAHAANDFVDAGLITETEHGAIVSAAGESTCGHKNK